MLLDRKQALRERMDVVGRESVRPRFSVCLRAASVAHSIAVSVTTPVQSCFHMRSVLSCMVDTYRLCPRYRFARQPLVE